MKQCFLLLALILISFKATANEQLVNSSDLLIAERWLSNNGGSHWKLLYNEQDGKRYRWTIHKAIYEEKIYVTFKADKQIDSVGNVIGGISSLKDQFFTLIIDRKTYQLIGTGLGG